MSTPSDPPIRRLVIEAFRGFRDRQEFDIAASAVIVAGPNGTGKTSFFDALQWALIGRIERLEAVRARPTVEHVVNQYRLDSRASVEVEISVGGREVRIRRTGDHRRSTLEFSDSSGVVLFGGEAESELKQLLAPNPGISLEMALTTSGLLQQDVMRAVLQAKPADRYRHISTVVGLSELEDFEDAVKEAGRKASGLADAARADRDKAAVSLAKARAQLERSEQQQLLRIPVEGVLEELRQLLANTPVGLEVDLGQPAPSEAGLASLARELGRVAEQVRDLIDAFRSLTADVARLDPDPDPESLIATEAAATEADSELAVSAEGVRNAMAALEAARGASEDVVRLAGAAIPLLSTKCPVCGQQIDPAHVEQELRTRAVGSERLLALQQALDSAVERERVATTNRQVAIDALGSLRSAQVAWASARERQLLLDQRFASLIAADGAVHIAAAGVGVLVDLAPTLLKYLAAVRRRLLEAADLFAQSSATGVVERSAAEVKSFEDSIAARNRRLEELSQRATLLKNLADASVEARVEVTERRFRAIQPLVADIFSRLDPHPAFKTIEFELDTYYRKGTTTPLVRDVVENVLADPLVIFSTSQANIAALSYFLAMGWTAGERSMPFVLLDDPLQSMDDVNVLGFADLCRHVRATRQLLISTHERRLSGLLERKLAPRGDAGDTVLLEFVGWDRSGPTVERKVVSSQHDDRPIRLVRSAS